MHIADKTAGADKTVGEIIRQAASQFNDNGIESGLLDARRLYQHASGLSSAQLISAENDKSDVKVENQFAELVKRRLNREPVHRIFGYREFYGREFYLSKETLEPRPETEGVIETISNMFPRDSDMRFVDIGSGSGAIGVTLLCEFPNASGIATDICADALEATHDNAVRYGVGNRLDLVQTNFIDGINGPFELIVSNPPYISENEFGQLQEEVRLFDPKRALVSGTSGFEAYTTILAQIGKDDKILKSGGRLIFEIGLGQAGTIDAEAEKMGFQTLKVVSDLQGIERIMVLKKTNDQ